MLGKGYDDAVAIVELLQECPRQLGLAQLFLAVDAEQRHLVVVEIENLDARILEQSTGIGEQLLVDRTSAIACRELLAFVGRVVDQATRDLGAVRRQAGDDFTAVEHATDRLDPDRQQRSIAIQQHVDRAVIERQLAGTAHVPGQPLLARRQVPLAGFQETAQRFASHHARNHVLQRAGSDYRVSTRARRELRRADLGLHAAATQLTAAGAGIAH